MLRGASSGMRRGVSRSSPTSSRVDYSQVSLKPDAEGASVIPSSYMEASTDPFLIYK